MCRFDGRAAKGAGLNDTGTMIHHRDTEITERERRRAIQGKLPGATSVRFGTSSFLCGTLWLCGEKTLEVRA